MNFQRFEHVFHQRQAWVKLQLALCLLYFWLFFSSTISHLLSLLQWAPLACFFDASPCLPPVVLLYFSRLKIYFIFCVCFFMYYLCKKYCKPVTVQYCVVDCVSWVPRLTLLDLGTNWTHRCTLRTEFICIWGTYCTA